MSLQYIFGGSGAGKSTYLYNSIIKESIKNPLENYIIVVPEQYTMATQKRVVELHPRKGVLNIDVVSFERLAYKVFEEVGAADYPVLDDTGKNLIVQLHNVRRNTGSYVQESNRVIKDTWKCYSI